MILDGSIVFQLMEKAKKKGEDELVAKREKLMVQLERLGRRTDEFSFLCELEMMQQVKHGLCFRIPLMKEFFLPFFFFLGNSVFVFLPVPSVQ